MSTEKKLHGRTFRSYPCEHLPELKSQMLNWANRFNICCFMDNHGYTATLHSFECLLAAGSHSMFMREAGSALPALRQFLQQENEWVFGHFGFGLKAETMNSPNSLPDPVGFPDCLFFVPDILVLIMGNELLISSYSADEESIFTAILEAGKEQHEISSAVQLEPALSEAAYIETVNRLKAHIHRGDCYEINFCQEFRAEHVEIDPVALYKALVNISPNPYSVYYKWEDRYLLCASPERFFCLENRKIWSQPIKGTAPRFLGNPDLDEQAARQLAESEKERSENVMVVDLVRNDLSRVCKPGTVQVEELFGVYSYPQVHQLISTISGELEEGVDLVDIIQACFPMGSMTGAPKKRVLQLIEANECILRGIFSGAVGYYTPDGVADFNVVIRSLVYNQQDGYLSCQVGSGITWYADAAKEYEECLWKASAIRKVLGAQR